MYRRAIDLDPHHVFNLANYAGFLCQKGETETGLRLAAKAEELRPEPRVSLELAFYTCTIPTGRATACP